MTDKKYLDFKNACILIAAVLIAIMIFIPPSCGVSDDGSLFTIASGSGIFGDIGSSYATFHFDKDNSAIYGNNTEVFLLSLMKNIFGGIDTRALAGIFSIILLLCMYFVLKTAKNDVWWINLLAAALVLLIFIDQGYIAYLNSIHKEAFIYIFMIAVFSCGYLLTREKTSVLPIIFYGLFGIGFIYLTPKYAFFGFLFAIFAFRVMILKKKRAIKLTALLVCVLLLVASFLTPRWEIPSERQMNLYNTVFYGISMTSSNFEKDLTELGLNTDLKALSKTSYFDKNTNGLTDETLDREFFQKMTYSKAFLFYIKHPVRYSRLCSLALNNGTSIKINYLANYSKDSGKGEGTVSHFYTLYSTLKSRIIPGSIFIHVAFLLAFLVFMIKFRLNKQNTKSRNLMYELFMMTVLCAVMAFKLPVIYHGLTNIGKTMFLYNVIFDILLTITIVGGSSILFNRRKRLQKEFGVTQ